MNVAIIFAGGTGQRMNTKTKPKQFLELHGKPIIVYTVEQYQKHEQIDGIIIVCLEEWIGYCQKLITQYNLTKVIEVVPGGDTGQQSIYKGLVRASQICSEDSIVLIHDGVRPLIDAATITATIECTYYHGSAITVSPAIETIVINAEDGKVGEILDRSVCQLAKAPQCFFLKDLLLAHENANREGLVDFIDSACIMKHYGHDLYTVVGPNENIKITTPADFYIFRAIADARENLQIFGI